MSLHIFVPVMGTIEEAIKQKRFKSPAHRLLVNVLFTASYLNTLHLQRLRPYDISVQQFNMLRILRGQSPKAISVNELIDRMLDKSSNASRLVEKLRQKGFVERNECPADRRRVDVRITQSGLDLLDKLDKDAAAMNPFKISGFSDQQVHTACAVLDQLREEVQ